MVHAAADPRTSPRPSSTTATRHCRALPVAHPPAAEPPSRAVSRLAASAERPDGVAAALTVAGLMAELPSRTMIDLGACLHDLCRDLDATFGRPPFGRPGGPSLDCSAAAHLVPIGQAITFRLVADLLVSDAYVHGFPPHEGGRIAVSLIALEAVVELTIDDSGRRSTQSRATTQGRADPLALAGLFVSQFGGWLETPEVVGGSSCIVTLPRQRNRLSS